MTGLLRRSFSPDDESNELVVISQRWAHDNQIAILRCLRTLPDVEVEDDDISIHLHFFEPGSDSGLTESDNPFAALQRRGRAIAFAALTAAHLELTASTSDSAARAARAIEAVCGKLIRPLSRNVTRVPRGPTAELRLASEPAAVLQTPLPRPDLYLTPRALLGEDLPSSKPAPQPDTAAERPTAAGRLTETAAQAPPLTPRESSAEPAAEMPAIAPRESTVAPSPAPPEAPSWSPSALQGRAHALGRALDDFLARTPNLEAAFLVTPSGGHIAGMIPHDCEKNVASITVKMLTLGTQAAQVLQRGTLQQVVLHGPAGYGILAPVVPGLLLLARVTEGARLGAVFHHIEETVAEIARIL